MFEPMIRIAAAALVAGAIAFAITTAPATNNPATNREATKQAAPQPYAKADRLPLHKKGAACSQHGWPDFEQRCQFDMRRAASEARAVRVIALR